MVEEREKERWMDGWIEGVREIVAHSCTSTSV